MQACRRETVYTNDCSKGIQPYSDTWLSTEQLEQLYIWIDKFQNFEASTPTSAFVEKLISLGTGKQIPTKDVKSEILKWINEIYLSIKEDILKNETEMGKIAYIYDGNIWFKDLPNGEKKQLTTDGNNHSPRWSPSGKYLAYFKDHQLCVMKYSTGETKILETAKLESNSEVKNFAWSSVEDILAHTTRR